MKVLVAVFLFLISSRCFAEPEDLHLFFGTGVNSALFVANDARTNAGLGLNFKTDVSYFLRDSFLGTRWALEVSSAVKFNRENEFFIWDTLLSAGLRLQLPGLAGPNTGDPYGRIFIGRAPTVVFLNGYLFEADQDSSISRVQFDGPLWGAALGELRRNSNGDLWFIEVMATVQNLEQRTDVSHSGDVPVVVSKGPVKDKSFIYSMYLMFGIMAF